MSSWRLRKILPRQGQNRQFGGLETDKEPYGPYSVNTSSEPADRLVTLFETKQKQVIEKSYKFQTRVLFAQLIVFIVTLGVLTFLSYRSKVDPTLALLIDDIGRIFPWEENTAIA
jgi:hypothetical protein